MLELLKQIFYGQHILEICVSPSLKCHQGALDFGTPQLMEISGICHQGDIFLHEDKENKTKPLFEGNTEKGEDY